MRTGQHHPGTQSRMERVAALEAEGVSIVETAAMLGVTPRTVSRMRAMNRGYQKPHAEPWTPEQIATFEQRLDDGWSYKEIGRTYGVCHQAVARHFPGRGWDRSAIGTMGASARIMNAIPDRVAETRLKPWGHVRALSKNTRSRRNTDARRPEHMTIG